MRKKKNVVSDSPCQCGFVGGKARCPIHKEENRLEGLVGEFDAQVWAKEFVKIVKEKPEIATDEGTMISWFASAIMAGYDRAKRELNAIPMAGR